MVNTTILLDTRKIKKDGTYPIIFRVYYQGKTSTRSTKIYVTEKQWDDKKKLIRNAHPQSMALNKRILKDFADLQSELILANFLFKVVPAVASARLFNATSLT